MADSASAQADKARLREWLERIRTDDAAHYDELKARYTLPGGIQLEALGLAPQRPSVTLESLIREGRPALLIQDGKITEDPLLDQASTVIARRLKDAELVLKPLFPLVGRIDVENLPGGSPFIGTGWLADPGIIVTNRHVAELVAQGGAAGFAFKPGLFGSSIGVSIDYAHEQARDARQSYKIKRVIWIQTDPGGADMAFMEVDQRGGGALPTHVKLAADDPAPGLSVAVIGYPARAPEYIIPDQDWMRRVYGDVFDVKRIAPGLTGAAEQGAVTHDCTTLGGNSGSLVADMGTGEAVALHFAGTFKKANYAVPASVIRRIILERPWQGGAVARPVADPLPKPPETLPAAPAAIAGAGKVTIPLTISLDLGAVLSAIAGLTPQAAQQGAPQAPLANAIRALQAAYAEEPLVAVRQGYSVIDGALSEAPCISVLAKPQDCAALARRLPPTFLGWPVAVRPAGLRAQLAAQDAFAREAVASIQYDDDARTDAAFAFAPLDEAMDVTCHVGPERSWEVLSGFLASTQRELVSSIYEFHADYICDAIADRLEAGVDLTLVMARQTLAGNDPVKEGEFARLATFKDWRRRFPARFRDVAVPVGRNGLVANAYHIKVSVQDGERVWLSSGNWKKQSQPQIAAAGRGNPRVTGAAGNREWHVVIDSRPLAQLYRRHIVADLARCKELLERRGESAEAALMADVPDQAAEGFEFEKLPDKVFEPLRLNRRVKVTPLLTPDRQGKVYCEAALALIRSAKQSLLIQNQYIAVGPDDTGLFGALIDAVAEKARTIPDLRILLRASGADFLDDAQELKRRGIDVMRCVRRIPATHTKGIIADGERVMLGSHNWSAPGVTLNRDASLIFDDAEIARYFGAVFEADWARAPVLRLAEPAPEAAPRLAAGGAPPPGFKRVAAAEALGP